MEQVSLIGKAHLDDERVYGYGSAMAEPQQPQKWMPHLWVVIVPVAAVLIAYALWFLLMVVLRAPDWLARIAR